MNLVCDGTDADIIRYILSTRLEREHDSYRKKLMEVAKEGILCVQADNPIVEIAFVLASLVDIKNNSLDAACDKYLSGDIEAFSTIDFKAAILPEEEREEVRFIKRALKLHEIMEKEGLLALEKHLDQKAVASRDIYDFGLSLVIDGWDGPVIDKIIGTLIDRETDPVRKKFAEAKDAATTAIYCNDTLRNLYKVFCAFFDKSITHDKEVLELVGDLGIN
jgi:flagellar motor component MotA